MRLEGVTTLRRRSISYGANLPHLPLGETTGMMMDSLRRGLSMIRACGRNVPSPCAIHLFGLLCDPLDITPLCHSVSSS